MTGEPYPTVMLLTRFRAPQVDRLGAVYALTLTAFATVTWLQLWAHP
jgi:hypothetical protein